MGGDGWMDGGQLGFTGLLCAVLNSNFCSSEKGWKTNDCHEIDTKPQISTRVDCLSWK